MKVTYKVLKTTLARELELYEKYLESCLAIRESIKTGDVAELKRAVKEQEHLVAAIGEIEASRQLLVDEFADGLSTPKNAITLRKVAEAAEEPVKKELTDLQFRLKNIVKDVQRENKINSILLGESLQYIRGSFEIIAGVHRKKDLYNANGKTPEQVNVARNILNRVA